jgi:hypothetical protein
MSSSSTNIPNNKNCCRIAVQTLVGILYGIVLNTVAHCGVGRMEPFRGRDQRNGAQSCRSRPHIVITFVHCICTTRLQIVGISSLELHEHCRVQTTGTR